ncbi:MAG TPA: SPOR domain-containing protein [Ramlibacter sp.]|nr:SPOR domain-containing protein [Ramlibacter sp.]
MAFFKFSKAGDEPPAARRPPESIEAMRKRARHRLIGAGVLVLAAVIGFPLLFDTQPRPIAVDIPIEIPDRNKVKPLPLPAQPATQAPAVSGPVTAAPAPAASEKVAAAAPPVAASPAEAPPPPAAEAKPQPERAPTKAAAAATAAPKSEDGAKAKALLEDKPVPVAAASADGRFVVQVGAFADPAKARAARLKVERAGLKTYTNVAETKDGKRVRVRVGPFANRAEADKAAAKIKGLDLPAAILTL